MVDLLRLDLDLFPRMQSPKEAQEDAAAWRCTRKPNNIMTGDVLANQAEVSRSHL
jgi:hypothetical protein